LAIVELARELRRAAAMLNVPAPGLGHWESDAARQVRDALRAADRATGRIADELRGCAAGLDSAAHDLAADQRAWRARKEER
jgi:hypothetical protein